jgi:exoribonuclease R
VKSEGMGKFSTTEEHYIVDASRLKARGSKTGQVVKMGDKVRVRVKSADLEKKQIDLVFTEEED